LGLIGYGFSVLLLGQLGQKFSSSSADKAGSKYHLLIFSLDLLTSSDFNSGLEISIIVPIKYYIIIQAKGVAIIFIKTKGKDA